jgi:hypothetical protein
VFIVFDRLSSFAKKAFVPTPSCLAAIGFVEILTPT